MSYEFELYPTEKTAIEAARNAAVDSAAAHDADAEEKVLLANGNTLVIKASPAGELTEKSVGGHVLSGVVFCSKKLSEKF
jgi:hypothetical protein